VLGRNFIGDVGEALAGVSLSYVISLAHPYGAE